MSLDATTREMIRAALDARMRLLLADDLYGRVCSGCGMPEDEWPVTNCDTCKCRARRARNRDAYNRQRRAERARRRSGEEMAA